MYPIDDIICWATAKAVLGFNKIFHISQPKKKNFQFLKFFSLRPQHPLLILSGSSILQCSNEKIIVKLDKALSRNFRLSSCNVGFIPGKKFETLLFQSLLLSEVTRRTESLLCFKLTDVFEKLLMECFYYLLGNMFDENLS